MLDMNMSDIIHALEKEYLNIYVCNMCSKEILQCRNEDKTFQLDVTKQYNEAISNYIDHFVYKQDRDLFRISVDFVSVCHRL